MTIETQIATTFDFSKTYGSHEEATEAARAADLSSFKITKNGDEWLIIDARLKPAKNADEGKAGDKPAKAKTPASKPAKPAKKGGAKKGLEARNAAKAKELDAAKAKEAAAKLAPKPQAAPGTKAQNYSIQTLPTSAMIEADSKDWINRGNPGVRDGFKAALKGDMPMAEPFNRNAATHGPFIKSLDWLIAQRDLAGKGKIAEALDALLKWKDGKGTRMNCSSTVPLGRFHQQLILALRAKLAAKEERAAKRTAKTNGKEKPAELPTS